ncbi:MAG: 3-phosphoshikimate 1-carboxyvinyltransferase [Candidatus Didemnitutus sp.]|nr:3-phosphoshikimate 1-carboxyvinyltransferase [Candidatus Didemnitutus sp.]
MSALPPQLLIKPFTRPVRGEVMPPGSKSITNRALLLAALCPQPVTLTEALFSEDSQLMIEALRALGLTVEAQAPRRLIRVSGQENAFKAERVALFVGLAGTAARFLTALCAAAPAGIYGIDGTARMRERPMGGVIAALRALGADIRCLAQEGYLPIEIHARGLRGGEVEIDAQESSQFLSALLLVAPLASAPITVRAVGGVRLPFVRLTVGMMAQFGQQHVTEPAPGTFHVPAPASYARPSGELAIEADASAASYLLALPVVAGGELVLAGLLTPAASLQGDIRFADALRAAGAQIGAHAHGLAARWEPGWVRRGITRQFTDYSDTFLTLAAIAPLLQGPTVITGIAHTRHQETDRVAGAAAELRRLGQHVIETEDSLEIHPRPLRTSVEIETYGDHRFAMSFAILGCHDLHGNGRPWLTIKHPACCGKTFPSFFDLLARLHAGSH